MEDLDRLLRSPSARRLLRLVRQLEASLTERIGPGTVVTMEVNSKVRDGSPESERAIELARLAAASMCEQARTDEEHELRNRLLSEVATELSNSAPGLLAHFVAESANLTACMAVLASGLDPEGASPIEELRQMIESVDRLRRPPA